MAVGAALALRGSGRLPVAVLGDGDYLMGVHRAVDGGALPHPAADRRLQQQFVLQRRAAPGPHGAAAQPAGRQPLDRPAHRRPRARPRRCWRAARAPTGFGPIRRPDELPRALRAAIDRVEAGGVALVDVRVEPGYAPAIVGGDHPRRALSHGDRGRMPLDRLEAWLADHVEGFRGPARRRALCRRPVEPDLSAARRLGRLCAAPQAARPAAAERACGRPRVPRHARAGRDAGAGAARLRAVRGRRGDRQRLLRDGVSRRPHLLGPAPARGRRRPSARRCSTR